MKNITPDQAGEIRGQLTKEHGATWMHHYHVAIEAEVLRRHGIESTVQNPLQTLLLDHCVKHDPDRKRNPDRIGRKISKNQARMIVNMVVEAAGGDVAKLSTVELLEVATAVAKELS
jgi:hypothetical protein